MKKLFFILSAIVFTTGAMAQVTPTQKVEQKDLKKDIKENSAEKKEVGNDLKKLRLERAVKDQHVVNKNRRHIHKHAKHLRQNGVEHPVRTAKKEIREEKKD